MSTAVTAPIRITPEAQARVVELGMQQEFTAMLDHARQTVNVLESVDVKRYDDPEDEDEPRVVITGWRSVPCSVDDPTRDQWSNWSVRAFSGDVRWNFGFSVCHRVGHDKP